jgi:hypothetical protein
MFRNQYSNPPERRLKKTCLWVILLLFGCDGSLASRSVQLKFFSEARRFTHLMKQSINSHLVTSLHSFLQEIEFLDLLAHQVLFRGQGVRGNLIPSIARKDPKVNTAGTEREMLRQLRLQGASLLPSNEETDIDLLVRAQHFGLKTRLLDWSSNPLVALWFACTYSPPGTVYIYALIADELRGEDVHRSDPFQLTRTHVLQPRMNNPRVIAQHGWFTLHRYSESSNRFVALEQNGEVSKKLFEYCIEDENRRTVTASLARLGLNKKVLFPDLSGLCEHLNASHGHQ